VNANPILDALGFNHSLKYGNRSKLRSACMRFLRFSYLLDFVATEALTNIYLFSVDETIRKLE
jgi:dynein heavy chain